MKSKKKNTGRCIGLALGGGGPRGLAHIGVIRALEENHIPINLITGTSAGSLIGGLYLALESITKVEEIAKTITVQDLISIFRDIGSVAGIIRGTNIETFLDRHIKKHTIEALRIPYGAVATDLCSGNAVTIKSGSLSKAIHASGAIPGLLESVEYEGKFLVDGAVSSPVPVRAAREIGATFVIAVNLEVYPFLQSKTKNTEKPNISSVSVAAINIMRYNLANEQTSEADVIITPDVASISSINFMQFINGADIIQKGYKAAMEMMPAIQRKIDTV